MRAHLVQADAGLRRRIERCFEFVRARDRKHYRVELRFNSESYGWEAQIFEGGEFLRSHGGFVKRAMAIAWAEEERKALEAGD